MSTGTFVCILLVGCSRNPTAPAAAQGVSPRTDTSGTCSGICDASPPSIPVLTDSVSYGDITTYGGTDTTLVSSGGACNYGLTGIRHYAAIQVNELPGDLRGQWNGGKACGQGVRVRARTDSGWKETYVRVMDKCPDGNCGIDLGGAPAFALMGTRAGRYSGEWSFVSCQGHPELFDGPPRIWVKDGSGADWSLVQVRDPLSAVLSLGYRKVQSPDTSWSDMAWATEAENFFKVPVDVLQDTSIYQFHADYSDGSSQSATARGTALAVAQDSLLLLP
jgi:expansin (peptidoglycan-binding protein)